VAPPLSPTLTPDPTRRRVTHASFPDFTPITIDEDEEVVRLRNLMGRAVAARTAGIDYAIGALYRVQPKTVTMRPMIKLRRSMLSIPVVKGPVVRQLR
jgi:hypothetical protein